MIVGLTGGIGSGKTTIARLFSEHLFIPIYIADEKAKEIISTNKGVQNKIIDAFGIEAFDKGEYNSKYIGEIVFNDKKKLKELNQIIHPVVITDFQNWYKQQTQQYVILESAILFESGLNKICNLIISILAPEYERIKRVMLRDNISKESVEKRMKNQWKDEKRIINSDFVIKNEDICKNLDKVNIIHLEILKKINNLQ